MDQNTWNDIQRMIYENKIEPPEVCAELLAILDDLDTRYSGRATIRTRNEQNKILTSLRTNYFTYVELGTKKKPGTIFAGALEKGPRSNKTLVIRVRSSNPNLTKVPSLFKFSFDRERNPEWTNIILSSMTISLLKGLLNSEVESYFASIQR